MKKALAIILTMVFLLLSGCGKLQPGGRNSSGSNEDANDSREKITEEGNDRAKEETRESGSESDFSSNPSPAPSETIDIYEIKPNEAGRVMIVMFHRFVESFTPSASDDGQFVITFKDFENLLETLYNKGYRLISLRDFLDNNIKVAPGFIPIIFTFDDGSSGQFNLIEENGELKVNPNSAVGIMEKFYKEHPDFGLAGTFYVNLGTNTFLGKGTLAERLNYLIDMGFEIGNHTLTHIDLYEAGEEKIIAEVGGNQKKMSELVAGYSLDTLALPFGNNARTELQNFVYGGEYEDVEYHNRTVLRVGWNPTYSPVNKDFNPLSLNRVRVPGFFPVDFDLNWWLDNLSREEQYISDGNPDKITVPAALEDSLDKSRLDGKELILY